MSSFSRQLKAAEAHISNFSLQPKHYSSEKLDGGNVIFFKGSLESVQIKFRPGVTNSRVFVGSNPEKGVRINLSGSNNLVYIGDNTRLGTSWIETKEEYASIIVGNDVTVTHSASFLAGQCSGRVPNGIILGDDAMLSSGITIRTTDAHPILDIKTLSHSNAPKKDVVIEPHVWIGQDAKILKGTHIGACSIISLGAVVTRDVPRFSVASGIPATHKALDGIWTRNLTAKEKKKAKVYVKLIYPVVKLFAFITRPEEWHKKSLKNEPAD